MHLTTLLTTTLTALAAADSSTIIGHFGANVNSGIVIPTYASTGASVAGINAEATTYAIDCLPDAPKTLCKIGKPWTMIQGPETYSLSGVYTAWSTGTANAVTATRNYDCTFTSHSISASCSWGVKVTGTTDGTPYSTSTTLQVSHIPSDSVSYYQLLVTDGISSFTAPQATKTPGAAPAPARPLITAAPLGAAAVAVAGAMI